MDILKPKLLSIIVPCYNEETVIKLFYQEILAVLKTQEHIIYELLFIDDGSKDHTLEIIKELADKDTVVKYVSFSRNFGKEAAVLSGLKHSKGDYVVLMDADLQDPPALLPQMINILEQEDFDCVATRRSSRKGEPVIRSWFARLFYRIINVISDVEIVDGARDFRMMKRPVVDAILALGEYNRFSKGIFGWVGFKTKWLEYKNIERAAGQTKWSFWKLFQYSLEGIVDFSSALLQFASVSGICLFIISMFMIVLIIIRTMIFGDPVAGWPSLVCIICFIGGIQLLSVGILGQYIARIYLETKKRPNYIERESNVR